MASLLEWKVPAAAQPRPEDYGYDLERTLSAVVGIHSLVPSDAFTAETVWLHYGDGCVAPGHALGFDSETGFGLVQALERLDLPSLPLGSSAALEIGERVVMGGAGGRTRSLAARVAAKQEFAGYWEYMLEQAIFTHPAHPNWGGTGLISPKGELVGIGSLQVERQREGREEHLNMVVPIDLLKPVLDDLRKFGRVERPTRPWLGVYSTEIEDKIVVVGIAPKGPAARAELKNGDVVVAVKGERVSTLGAFYRKVWALGQAGVAVPLTLYREGVTFDVSVNSSDRAKFLKAPRMH